jgi:hypothetical protein
LFWVDQFCFAIVMFLQRFEVNMVAQGRVAENIAHIMREVAELLEALAVEFVQTIENGSL